jgi:hypothetical protein
MTTEESAVTGNPFEGPELSESDDFFNTLDNNLGTVEHPEQPTPAPEQVTSQQVIPDEAGQQGNESVNVDTNWQKRYNDSSSEARRLKAENDELKPFKSVINFLKEDSGAVEMLQGYLKGGGQVPQNVQEELKLNEDFIFDMDEATKDPESDSGKLFNRMVEKKAQTIVNGTLQQERQRQAHTNQQEAKIQERQAFMQRKGYTEEQMRDLESRAKQKTMTYDDLDFLLNKEQVAHNVQRSAQNDMMNQMNAVRDIPTSIGGTNNAGQGMTGEEQFFNSMFGDQFKDDDNPF